MTASILHERNDVADCLLWVRCARTMVQEWLPCTFWVKQLARLCRKETSAKSLVIPQAGGYASSVSARDSSMSSPLLNNNPFALSVVTL